MRPDEDVHLPGREVGERALHVGRAAEPRHHLAHDREVAVALSERVPVLLREDRGRRQHERLPPVERDREGGPHGDLRLAEADVAADEPVHRARRLEVLLHRLDRLELVRRLAVRERRFEPLEPVVREVEGDAGGVLALRVERQQLPGQLARGMAGAALDELPGAPAELRERRVPSIRTDVARHLAHLVVRHVQPVLPAEREQQVVARDPADGLGLEAEQLPDAVILVDDVVPRAEVGERPQCPRHTGLARRPPPEDLRLGHERDAELAPDEPRRAGEAAKSSAPSAGRASRLEHRASARRSRRCVRRASPRWGKETTTRRPERTSAFSSRSASAMPRAASAGRCASNASSWPLGKRIELGAVAPDRRRARPARPRARRGLQTRSACRARRRYRPGRAPHSREVGPALAAGKITARSSSSQRALRERREGADAFDDVAEELDADRLAPRRPEDVENAAANGDLAAFLHALDALVPGEDERLGQLLEPARLAHGDLDGRRPLVSGRQSSAAAVAEMHTRPPSSRTERRAVARRRGGVAGADPTRR